MLKALAKVLGANQKSVLAAGTVYSLTNTSAAVTFGTTSPSITLDQAGTYLIIARSNLLYNAATFAAVRDVTIKLRRTNNTPADLAAGMTTLIKTAIITALTYTFGDVFIAGLYTTTAVNDIVSLYADVSVVPTVGSLDITEANIIAIRLNP